MKKFIKILKIIFKILTFALLVILSIGFIATSCDKKEQTASADTYNAQWDTAIQYNYGDYFEKSYTVLEGSTDTIVSLGFLVNDQQIKNCTVFLNFDITGNFYVTFYNMGWGAIRSYENQKTIFSYFENQILNFRIGSTDGTVPINSKIKVSGFIFEGDITQSDYIQGYLIGKAEGKQEGLEEGYINGALDTKNSLGIFKYATFSVGYSNDGIYYDPSKYTNWVTGADVSDYIIPYYGGFYVNSYFEYDGLPYVGYYANKCLLADFGVGGYDIKNFLDFGVVGYIEQIDKIYAGEDFGFSICFEFIDGSQYTSNSADEYFTSFVLSNYNLSSTILRRVYFVTARSDISFSGLTSFSNYKVGYDLGYDTGFNLGHSTGYNLGYDKGYDTAVNEGTSGTSLLYGAISFTKVCFQLATNMLATPIAGDITVGLIVIGLPMTKYVINAIIDFLKKFTGNGAKEGVEDE